MEESDVLLREMEEDLRRERLRLLWKRFGNAIIGLSAGVIVITLLSVAWKSYQESREVKHTSAFLNAIALEDSQPDQAAQRLGELAAKASKGDRAALVSIQQGQVLVKANKPEEAKAAFKTAQERAGDEMLQGIAALWLLALGEKTAAIDIQENAFSASLRERQAIEDIHHQPTAETREYLEAIIGDEQAPATLKVRAQQWLSLLP